MNDSRMLIVELLDYWHCGTGRGSNEYLDALVDRDSRGLPYVPGKMLKGLLRHALVLCEAFGQVKEPGLHRTLFGGESFIRRGRGPDSATEPAQPAEPGCLRVSDARLPEDLAAWLRRDDAAAAREALSRDLFATAINPETGAALRRSLRGMEVIVPLELQAEIGPLPGRTAPADWAGNLAKALPLVRALGHQRSRGLGRCTVRFSVSVPIPSAESPLPLGEG